MSYFPNWVDTDHIKPLGRCSHFRAELGLTDDVTIALYSGSFGGKQGLMMLPDMARRLLHIKQLVFVIRGEGVMRADLEAACADLLNTKILPLQPFEKLGELLSMADIHLLPQSAGAEDMLMPSKLSGMLASGRPTVATCRPDTEIAMVIARRGIVVPPDDVTAFADAVAQLVEFPEQRLSMGEQARRYAVENLGRDAMLSRFANQAIQLAGKPGNSVPSWP